MAHANLRRWPHTPKLRFRRGRQSRDRLNNIVGGFPPVRLNNIVEGRANDGSSPDIFFQRYLTKRVLKE